jgi:5-methylthioadenosine/S-adenosylhomocysteine deaminase
MTSIRRYLTHLDWALTADEARPRIADAALVLEDTRIRAIGTTDEVLAVHPPRRGDEVMERRGHGLTPGFVDTHVHLSETLSRAVFPDTIDTRTWVFHWGKPFYAHVSAEDEAVSVVLGTAEMLRAGTTCFLDMGAQNDPGITARAAESTGIRGIVGRHAADRKPERIPRGWSEEMIEHHFFPNYEVALDVLEQCVLDWNGYADGRIRCWVNIEGKEPCSLELHVGARALAERLGVGTTYHLASNLEEAEISESRYGQWPVERVAANGGLGENLVIAHAVAVRENEVRLMAEHDTSVAFCPGTSLKIAKGATCIGLYPEMMESGVTVGLGTDGVSASGNLNLMRQMYVVAGLFKDARRDPRYVGAAEAFRMATIDGARALGWDDEIGSLEAGKKADFVLFDLDHFEWIPYDDPLNALVWSATSASIAETWVDGRRVFAGGHLVDIDEDELRSEARARAAAIVQRAGLTAEDIPLSTKLYA